MVAGRRRRFARAAIPAHPVMARRTLGATASIDVAQESRSIMRSDDAARDNADSVKSKVWIIQHPNGHIVGVYPTEELASEVQRAMTALSGWAGYLSEWEVFQLVG